MLDPNNVELLIFDMDGTIFPTTKPVYESVKRAFAKLDLPLKITEEEMEKYFGTATGEFYKALIPENSSIRWEDIREPIIEEHESTFKEFGETYPGVKETLQTLKDRGYKLVLHSNAGVQYFNTAISALGIRDYFDYTECVRENNLTKNELVRKIKGKFGNAETAVVGDRIDDIESARENNSLPIGVLYGYGKKEPEKADITISSFPELLYIFDRKLPVFEAILAEIKKRKQKDRAYVVGITGIDCSGKSRFAESLESYLLSNGFSVQPVHIDDFHNPSTYRYSGDNQAENYFNKSFDIETIIDEIMIPVREEGFFTRKLTLLNLSTDKYEMEKEYSVNQDTIVVIEGVFLLREELAPYIDLKVFLDISFEECKRRASIRDNEVVLSVYDSKYLPAQRKYLDEFPPSETADIVIDNSNWKYPRII
ncbi:HAD hydrolase-like protein [Chloroflexota bacterium]